MAAVEKREREPDVDEEQNEPPRKKKKKDKGNPIEILGDGAKATIEIKEEKFRDGDNALKAKDIQDLVLWASNDGVATQWIFVKNKSLINQVVVLMLNSLGASTYFRHSASLPALSKGFPTALRTLSPGNKRSIFSFQQVLLSVPLDKKASKKAKKEREHVGEKPPPSHYVLSLADMRSNNFPLNTEHRPAAAAQDIAMEEAAATPEVEEGELASTQTMPSRPQLPPPDWQRFEATRRVEGPHPTMAALDCEMVYTAVGLELARVTVLDESGQVIVEEFVLPEHPIIDYNTKYSGITEEMLRDVRTTPEAARAKVQAVVGSDTILIGHSLESDLGALRLIHYNVVDTSVLYPDSRGHPYKRALRSLASQFLKRGIQGSKDGHDSAEDARAALDLAQLKFKNGPEFGLDNSETESIFMRLQRVNRRCSMIDRLTQVKMFTAGSADGIACRTDAETAERAVAAVTGGSNFVFAQFHDLETHFRDADEGTAQESVEVVLERLNSYVAAVRTALPPNSLFIIVTGHGDQSAMKKLGRDRRQSNETGGDWSADQEQRYEDAVLHARRGLTFITVAE